MNNKKLIGFVMSVFMISSVSSDTDYRELATKCDHDALHYMQSSDNVKASIGSNSILFFIEDKAIFHANKDFSNIGNKDINGKYLIFNGDQAEEIKNLAKANTTASGLIKLALDKIMDIYNKQETKDEYAHEDDHDKAFSNVAYSLFNSGSILSNEDKPKALEAFLSNQETYIKININTLKDADIKELFDFVKTTFYLDRDDSDKGNDKNIYVERRNELLNSFKSSDMADTFQIFTLYVLDGLNSIAQKSISEIKEDDTWHFASIKDSINDSMEIVVNKVNQELKKAEAEEAVRITEEARVEAEEEIKTLEEAVKTIAKVMQTISNPQSEEEAKVVIETLAEAMRDISETLAEKINLVAEAMNLVAEAKSEEEKEVAIKSCIDKGNAFKVTYEKMLADAKDKVETSIQAANDAKAQLEIATAKAEAEEDTAQTVLTDSSAESDKGLQTDVLATPAPPASATYATVAQKNTAKVAEAVKQNEVEAMISRLQTAYTAVSESSKKDRKQKRGELQQLVKEAKEINSPKIKEIIKKIRGTHPSIK